MGSTAWTAALLFISLATHALGQPPRTVKKKKPEKDPANQTLPLPKEPPGAVAGATARLIFHVSPLSDKGLLSQQTRDSLKALMQENRGATILKLRAFTAGTGDMRRVQAIVSEVFTEKKLPLPALSTIQVGALPLEGAQVELESVSVLAKQTVNPNGLVFFPAAALDRLEAAAKAAHISSQDMLRVTCFFGSLDKIEQARMTVARAFPMAAADFVQPLRLNTDAIVVCEAVGRAFPVASGESDAAGFLRVTAPTLIFSGTQMAFGSQDADVHLAFERLEKALQPLGASYKDVVYSNVYSLTGGAQEKVRAMQPGTVGATLLFEGLPSLDATMAVEAIAARY